MSAPTPKNINVRNPLAIQRVLEELSNGKGRNISETAENLILEGSSRRQVSRAKGGASRVKAGERREGADASPAR
jgi:hypothetical protein